MLWFTFTACAALSGTGAMTSEAGIIREIDDALEKSESSTLQAQ